MQSSLEDGACGPDRFEESHVVAEGFVAVLKSLADPGLVMYELCDTGMHL